MSKIFGFYVESIAGWSSFLLNTKENRKIVTEYEEAAKEHFCFRITKLYKRFPSKSEKELEELLELVNSQKDGDEFIGHKD